MASIQSILKKAIADQLSKKRLVAMFIIRSAKDQGLGDLTPHQKPLEDAVEKWMSDGAPLSDSLSLVLDDGLQSEAGGQVVLDSAEFEKFLHKCVAALTETIPEVTKDTAAVLLEGIKKTANEGQIAVRRFEEEGFRDRLSSYWGKAFDLLFLEIELARECGAWCATRLLTKRRKRAAPLTETVFLLHARACRVAGEVRALLEAGYGGGAYARWRTLHEIAVTTDFLIKHGDAAAHLYLEHVDIDSWRTAVHMKETGSTVLSHRAMARLERAAERLKEKYGKAFGGDYGWAAVTLQRKSATFADIERDVGLEKARPAVKLASNMVHAGPKGALFKMGLLDGWAPTLVAGPSNVGLDEAGRHTGHSLMHVTANLLHLRVNADTLVWSQLMLTLSGEVQQAFERTQRRIARDEATANRPRRRARTTPPRSDGIRKGNHSEIKQ